MIPGAHTLTCVICGKAFTGRARNITVCSDACLAARKRRYQCRYWHARLSRMSDAEREAKREVDRAQKRKRDAERSVVEPRECVMCGASFRPRNGSQRTCSPVCSVRRSKEFTQRSNELAKQARANRTKMRRPCVVCGEMFFSRTVQKKTCSQACAIARGTALRRVRRAQSRPEPSAAVKKCKACAVCGVEFVGTKHQTCCSPACAHKARQRGALAAMKEARERNSKPSAVGSRDLTLKRSGPHTFTTQRCAACNALVEKRAMKSGCCSDACVDRLAQRVVVNCMSSQVAVGERVLVAHYETRSLSDGPHLVQVSDAGTIVDVSLGQARIDVAGRTITAPVADIATTKSIIERVRESLGESYDDRIQRLREERQRKRQAISA